MREECHVEEATGQVSWRVRQQVLIRQDPERLCQSQAGGSVRRVHQISSLHQVGVRLYEVKYQAVVMGWEKRDAP